MSTSLGALPAPLGVVPNLGNPADVLRTIALVTNGLVLGLATLFTLGRFYVRFCITGAVFIEDWFCIASWILTAIFCIAEILSSLYGGGGYHAWEISTPEMVHYQKTQYAAAIIYGPCVWCIKVALLLILVRVFTPFRKVITMVWGFIYAMLVYYIIVTALKVFVCNPISSAWDTSISGKCLNTYVLYSIDTALSILTDLIILLLPIPLVWSLQVTTKKKLRTMALLGAGGVATGTSIVRLILVLQLDDSFYQLGDQTVSITRINLLVTAELGIGIICACLPAFNIFFFSTDRSSRPRYVDKSMQLSDLSSLAITKVSSKSSNRGLDGNGNGSGKSASKESYAEIRTPEDIGALMTPPEGAMRRGSWPLRTSSRVESYFELKTIGEV